MITKSGIAAIIFVFVFLTSCKKDPEFSNLEPKNKQWSVVKFLDYDWKHISIVDSQTAFVFGYKTVAGSSQEKSCLIKTSDGGKTWQLINDKQNLDVLNCCGSICFLNLQNGFKVEYQHLYKTNDGGHNWDTVSGQRFIEHLYKTNQTRLFGGGSSYFYESIDGGNNWHTNKNLQTIRTIDFIDELSGFAAGDDGIYASADGGGTWSKIATNTLPFIKIDFINKNTGLAIYNEQTDPKIFPDAAVSITTDGGLTWSKLSTPFDPDITSHILLDSDAGIYVAGFGINYSIDGGKTWMQLLKEFKVNDIKKLGDQIIAVGNAGDIYRK